MGKRGGKVTLRKKKEYVSSAPDDICPGSVTYVGIESLKPGAHVILNREWLFQYGLYEDTSAVLVSVNTQSARGKKAPPKATFLVNAMFITLQKYAYSLVSGSFTPQYTTMIEGEFEYPDELTCIEEDLLDDVLNNPPATG